MAASRLAALQALLAQHQLDVLLVPDPANRRYLSGFTGSAGILVIDAESGKLVTDGRYTTQAINQSPGWQVVTREQHETLWNAVARLVAPFKRIGFDPQMLSYADYVFLYQQLQQGQALMPLAGLVEQLRAVKDAAEIATLRRAVALTDQALAAVKPLLKPELTERQVAWMLHQAMVERGAAGPAFEIIVAAGPNSALPHARPTDAELGSGRPIIIDMGALVDGYHGDMTRTFVLGTPDAQWATIYDLVLQALQTATHGIKPGTTGQQADALARDVIKAAGYGEAFGHGLGHGVGLEIHEQPRLNSTNTQPLPVGSIWSIEPGVYLPDWGGVRLENLALLHAARLEVLTESPLDQAVIPLA